ncbi:hypothetical protein GCM10027456_47670 [Kineosporia babensis]
MALAMTAWVGFALSTRAISFTQLEAPEVAAIRFLAPTVLLLPWWRKALQEISQADPKACLGIAVGGGLPFFLITAWGAGLSSAAHVSIVNLGAAPLLIALTSRRFGPQPAIIATGIAVLALGTPGSGAGVLILLASAALWTIYTLTQGKARLSPLTTVLLMSAPWAIPALLLADWSSLSHAPATEIWLFVIVQGIASGILSAVSYAIALRELGAWFCSLAGAITPAIVMTLAAFILNEIPSPMACLGMAIVLAGTLPRPRRRPGQGTQALDSYPQPKMSDEM